MLRKEVKHLLWAIVFMVPIYSSTADKVVVIPLGGDEAPTSKVAFVTKGSWGGNLGGPSGADAKCQAEADAPGSKVQGLPFKAWVSGGLAIDFTAGGRVFTQSDLPYKLVDGSFVATNYNDLVNGDALTNNIALHADGAGLATGKIWTGIDGPGTYAPLNCVNWSTSSFSQGGSYGVSYLDTAGWWTWYDVAGCDLPYHLYCFEQG